MLLALALLVPIRFAQGQVAMPDPAMAQAEIPVAAATPSRLRLNGYGTIGLAHIDQPTGWAFRRDISEPGDPGRSLSPKVDSRLGLQLNFAASERLELVAQAVLRTRSDHGDLAAVEWAFAAFRPTPEWTLRVGRLNPDAFLLSDHRNVGFAYPWVRPEVGFYGAIPLYSVAGADLQRRWTDGDSYWRLKAYLGQGQMAVTPWNEMPASVVKFRPAMGISLAREANGLTVKANLSRFRIGLSKVDGLVQLDQALAGIAALPIPPIQAQAEDYRGRLGLVSGSLNFVQLGARYEGSDWLWSGELAKVWGRYPSGHLTNGYFSLGRRLGAVTLFGVVGASRAKDSELSPPQWAAMLTPMLGLDLAAQIQQAGDGAVMAINANRQQQRSLSLGLRWDLSARFAVKVQWDRFLVEPNGSRAFRNAANQGGRVDVGAVVLDFVF